MCPWGQFLAQILDLPTICSMTMFVITTRLIASDPAQMRNRLASGALIKQIQAITTHISATYHVRKMGIFDLANNAGQLNIVFTSKKFQPDASAFDESYRFVGPSILPRVDAPSSFPYEVLDKDRSLIYIAFGTLYNVRPEFYRLCFAAFAQSSYQVVLSVGCKTPISSLGVIPPNFIVREYVPQLEILQRAALFISHGGMNSTSEALYYGVPLIAIPQSADQPWVARRVARLGAGKMLSRPSVKPHTLRRAADEILANPAYAQASAAIGESFRQAGGYQRAADEIQYFMRHASHYLAPKPGSWGKAVLEKLTSL
jgi:MGT family glycosyltransferase